MHFEIAFDARLREKSTMLDSDEAKKAYKVQKLCLSRIRNVTIVTYYFIVPYFETPDWCLKFFKRDDTPSVDGIFVPCQDACDGIVKYSDMPKLIPIVCSSLDLFCLLNLCIYRMYKQRWRKLDRWDKVRNWIFLFIMIVCSADVIRAAVFYQYPYINNLCRPWVCIIFFSSIRQNLKSVVYDFKDSLIILACIFLYISYFTAIGFFILEGTFTGYADFDTYGDTFY